MSIAFPYREHIKYFFYKNSFFQRLTLAQPIQPCFLNLNVSDRGISLWLIPFYVLIIFVSITEKGISVPVDIDTLIGAIYISPFATNHFQDSVRATMEKYGIAKQVFRSRFKSQPFKKNKDVADLHYCQNL